MNLKKKEQRYKLLSDNLNIPNNLYLDKTYRQKLEELPQSIPPNEVDNSAILGDLQWQETHIDRYKYTSFNADE